MKSNRDNSFLCSLLYDRFYEDVVGCLKRAVTRILLLSNSSFHYSLFKSPAALIFSLLVFWIIRQWFIIISILHSITNRSPAVTAKSTAFAFSIASSQGTSSSETCCSHVPLTFEMAAPIAFATPKCSGFAFCLQQDNGFDTITEPPPTAPDLHLGY